MAPIARTPHRADRPTTVAVGVPVGAARRRHDHPTALRAYEVTDEVIREVITPLLGHRVVVSRRTDRVDG
jgi:hypothetical protein